MLGYFAPYDGPIEVGSTYAHRAYDHLWVTVTGIRERQGQTVVDYEVHRPWGCTGPEAATEEYFRDTYRG